MASIAEILEGHVTLEVECVDRLYLNGVYPESGDSWGAGGFLA